MPATIYYDQDADLSLLKGKTLGLVGESGCGKSMFASAIYNMVPRPGRITRGSVIFDGRVDVLKLKGEELRRFRWKEMSIVFQAAMNSLNPVMKIRDQMVETILDHEEGVGREEALERSRRALELVRLDPERVLDSYPHELSGGMRQRVVIAMSLLLNPKFVILDEPVSALDLKTQMEIVKLLKSLHEDLGITMLFITHDLPVLSELGSDRITVMYAFEFVEVGPRHKVLSGPLHPYSGMLIDATLDLEKPVERTRPIPGPPFDPFNVPSGCRFHPRCPYATERCRREEPPTLNVNGRLVKCFLYG